MNFKITKKGNKLIFHRVIHMANNQFTTRCKICNKNGTFAILTEDLLPDGVTSEDKLTYLCEEHKNKIIEELNYENITK
jgi:hypothetical protein